MTRKYGSAAAFKQALEQRLRTASASGIDLALIATAGPVEARRLRAAIEQTFAFRGTHDVPAALPEPPATWQAPYATIAKDDQLQWDTLADAHEAASAFLAPVLAGLSNQTWDPQTWSWTEREE